jgi:hypothetical protein
MAHIASNRPAGRKDLTRAVELLAHIAANFWASDLLGLIEHIPESARNRRKDIGWEIRPSSTTRTCARGIPRMISHTLKR